MKSGKAMRENSTMVSNGVYRDSETLQELDARVAA